MGGSTGLSNKMRVPLRWYVWGVAAAWTILVAVLGEVIILNEQQQIEERARAIARTTFHGDRHWVDLFGKIYFPVTPDIENTLNTTTPPPVVVSTTTGERLALMSPTAVREIILKESNLPLPIRTRLTSLRPSRPENAADDWEANALRSFEQGDTEQTAVENLDGVPHLRFIGALYAETACMRCHAGPDDTPGKVRGALSIAVPLEPFWSLARSHTSIGLFTLGVLWVVGLAGIALGNVRLKRRIAERDKAIEERLRSQLERQRIESALQDSEERYRRIVKTSREGIWEIDVQGRTTYVNKAMADMLGYTVEEMMGRTMYDFMDERARAEAETNLERRRAHVAEQHDFRLRRRDGSDLWTIMSTNPMLDQDGAFRGALAMVTDISRRKRMEDALKASESRYRTLFESNLAGVYRTTLDGTILDCNDAMVRLLGLNSAEELKKSRARDFYVDPADREAFLAALRERGVLTSYSLRLRRRDGDIIWVLQNVTLEEGVIQGTIVDVTRERQAQEALHEAEKRLRLESMRTQIAADLHDEIGSTLSSISVFNEMLKHEITDASPRAQQLLHRVEENLRGTQDALHEIVWTINPENDSLENILLTLQQYAADLLEARGIRFEFMVPDQPLSVRLPMEKRRQVYLIMKEALNNMVRHSSCTQAFLGVYVDRTMLTLTVRDNGKGFDPGTLRSGNGLRNMEIRTTSIGGALTISAADGTGTTITLRVPIA